MPTVLIVEPDPVQRNLLREILSRHGYIVLDSVSPAEALQLLRKLAHEDIDLVIAELCDGTGESLAYDVTRLRPAVKILFTSDGGPYPFSPTYAAAGSAFLYRPFTEARLIEEVSGLLNPTTQ